MVVFFVGSFSKQYVTASKDKIWVFRGLAQRTQRPAKHKEKYGFVVVALRFFSPSSSFFPRFCLLFFVRGLVGEVLRRL